MTLEQIEEYGIIGAGGAGFPAHVKLKSKPDTVIMNAAECEPLLHKDMALLLNFPETVLKGFEAVIDITGAREGLIGIKNKHAEEIELLESKKSDRIKIKIIDDVYPAGDEITLIYMTTNRVVQPGALPISVGCVVQNVETLYNIGRENPVVTKFISVAGAVENPATIEVPVGISFSEILSNFKITAEKYVVRSGGLMMGALETDLNKVVSKRTGALIVLPENHHCVNMYTRFATDHQTDLIAKAACDQCYFCTELCPRYLLGYPVRPETAMRNRMFTREDMLMLDPGNISCCECNLCTMYSCPEGLDPRGATVIEKRIARGKNLQWLGEKVSVHPMFDYRKVPTEKLKQRLDVNMFKDEGPLSSLTIKAGKVRIPLNQHLGAPAAAVVKEGDRVVRGSLIAKTASAVSCNMHASIDGVVTGVDAAEIIIEGI